MSVVERMEASLLAEQKRSVRWRQERDEALSRCHELQGEWFELWHALHAAATNENAMGVLMELDRARADYWEKLKRSGVAA